MPESVASRRPTPEKQREYHRRWYEKRGKAVRRAYGRSDAGKAKAREGNRRIFAALRRQIMERYECQCARCGESDIRVLHIDHKDGGGNKERRDLGTGKYYRRVLSHPDEYDLLCVTCNFEKSLVEAECRPKSTNASAVRSRRSINALRKKAIEAIGGRECLTCGYSGIAIQIDHKLGSGNREKIALGRAGMYRRIMANPIDYQPLCPNCNWIKRLENKELKWGDSVPACSFGLRSNGAVACA